MKGEDDVEIGVVARTSTRVYKVEHEEGVQMPLRNGLPWTNFIVVWGISHLMPLENSSRTK